MRTQPNETLLENAESLRGKVVLITGGASGFGRETALLSAKYGAHVLIADLKSDLVEKALAEIRKAGGKGSAPADPVDVTKPESIRQAFEYCIKELGRVPDAVIANAGVTLDDHFEDDIEIPATRTKPAHARPPRDLTLAVNYRGAISTCEIAQAYWKDHLPGGGEKRKLVILSSMGGITGISGGTLYSASKHGVLGYWQGVCRKLQNEGQAGGFEFYAICPFFANTRIFHPATLLALAGIPLVPKPLIAQCMLYVITKPSTQTTGEVVLLPDHLAPIIAPHTEYDPLSPAWQKSMQEEAHRTGDWFKVSATRRIWRDIAQNYYGVSSLGLAMRACVILLLAWGFKNTPSLLFKQLSNVTPAAPVILGCVLGLAGKLRDRWAVKTAGDDKKQA